MSISGTGRMERIWLLRGTRYHGSALGGTALHITHKDSDMKDRMWIPVTILALVGSQFLLAAIGVEDGGVRILLAGVFGALIGVAVWAAISLARRQ